MTRWADLPISRKLYLVIGTMALLLAGELATLRFAMRTLSAVRAFVAGEGSWSKAQKDAAIALQRYALYHHEPDYRTFLDRLSVPAGDHRARLALMSPHPDLDVARRGFLDGQIHPDDIDSLIDVLQRFSRVSYLARAIEVWGDGDARLSEFLDAGRDYHTLVVSGQHDPARESETLGRVERLNAQLTQIEDEFSNVLGEGSRWLERVIITLLSLAVLTVESVGLTLTLMTTRQLSRGLAGIETAATRIGRGEFGYRVDVRSRDEIGRAGAGINQMGVLLERSYSDLEQRVRQRTAELERLAQENARLYEAASNAVTMRDEFFSIASHELRTPLTALHLRLQLLERALNRSLPPGDQREKALEMVESCSSQATRLTKLSSELLDLTRIRLGKFELDREPCDLASIAHDVVGELAADAGRAGSELKIDAGQPVTGHWDPVRLGQVIRNLLSNAIKYGDGQPIEVIASKEGEVAALVVRDHGGGIPPEEQERLFARFERLERDARVPGLGLGLYITRQIVEAHGGTITVDSAPGKGSVFTVRLNVRGHEGDRPAVANVLPPVRGADLARS
jgi:signal transduction histidine kinase